MVLTLYVTTGSSPCHQLFLTAKLLNLELEVKTLDLMKKEHMTPEYLKINPQHTVPTLVDGDFIMWESRAISRYLVNKYGAGSNLYPQDPQIRAVVDQRLDFDLGTLYQRFMEYYLLSDASPEEAKLKRLEEALGFLNTFLEGNKYTAGDDLTIADLALVASIANINGFAGVSFAAFPNLQRWFQDMKSTPGYQEAIQKNVDNGKAVIEQYLKAKKAGKV